MLSNDMGIMQNRAIGRCHSEIINAETTERGMETELGLLCWLDPEYSKGKKAGGW
jgi:hypothetical protein